MGRDLRAVFGSNDRGLTADEVFANRQAQWQAVLAALAEHIGRITAPGFDVEDLEAPRHNVLVFHGIGGIGKSTLSRTIEASLADSAHRPPQWAQLSWPQGRVLPIRIDLARSAGVSFEHVVLSIRLALATLGRPMPAFDLALHRYWERQHPGEPLEDHLRRSSGVFARFSAAVDLPEQLRSGLGDVAQALLLPGTVGTVVGSVTGALVRALREHRSSVRALAGCARLADLLEAEPDLEMLSYTAHLLAWDLAQSGGDHPVVPVILLDTWEDVGDRTHRDLERLLQRVVWLMPNALFLVTGRNRLQWADRGLSGQLDWTGPTAWPGLAPHGGSRRRSATAARQILIGDLAPPDCDDYLARRLTHDGQPLIGADIRRVITERSHGLPLYLDLSVGRFLELRRTGRAPEAADFDHDFPALIARTLRDLSEPERDVLRSAALLDAFSVALATDAAGLDREAAAARLVERPFVLEDPTAPLWPYHLHQAVRAAIRHAADPADDHWTHRDWTRAASRAFHAIGAQFARTPHDRTTVVACLRQGLRLARDYSLPLDWLTDAALAYVADSVWEPLAPPGVAGAASGRLRTAADALVETLSALARRQHEHREHTATRLAAVVDTGLLPAVVDDMAVYYLAKAQRDLGRSEASRHGMSRVVAGGGRFAPAARRGLAHLARLAGDFPTALATARTLGWEGRHYRVLGEVWWPQGEVARAAEAFAAARAEAEQHAVTGEAATAQSMRALVLAFLDPDQADAEIELATTLLLQVDLRATALTTRIAALVRDAGQPGTDFDHRVRALRTEITAAGLPAAEATLQLAVCFHRAVLDTGTDTATDPDLDIALTRLRELTRSGGYAYYTDIAHFMAARPLPPELAPPTRWLDPQHLTRDRWRTLVTSRRHRQP
ncbi:ATP/GTP-binding protein [Streptacidiphilus sp. P02-A3a]|uniref:ATP/GTP-binding protein n=1 Tax=Streptacidiphilus sp. P02-A3a TaxID=2704468 RepID=UPI0015FD08EC|nr:ATP/GTP-binding protein [Streptacidiphilus sp. P02-A3a]QMU69373.1 ATP/GTP-binding protein [Streptacidiphilus sp. P02-A3a]